MSRLVRKRVSVVIVNDNKILGFHAEDPFNKKKYFFLPGGEIEKKESKEETAIRETLEETGYKIGLVKNSIIKNYDFEWNGRVFDCETTFFLGKLISLEQNFVKDADYNRGVDWIPVDQIKEVLGYHADILSAILELLA